MKIQVYELRESNVRAISLEKRHAVPPLHLAQRQLNWLCTIGNDALGVTQRADHLALGDVSMGLQSVIHNYIIEHSREELVGLNERGGMNIYNKYFVRLDARTTALIIASLSLRDILWDLWLDSLV